MPKDIGQTSDCTETLVRSIEPANNVCFSRYSLGFHSLCFALLSRRKREENCGALKGSRGKPLCIYGVSAN